MPSPLKAKHTQKSTLSESMQLNDSLSKELQPIVYTPEDCRKTSQNPCTVTFLKPSLHTTSFQANSNINSNNSSKMLCEVDTPLSRRKEYGQEDLDPTFIIREDTRSLKSTLPEQESLSNNNVLQRYRKRVFANSSFFFSIAFKLLAFFFFFSYISVYFIEQVCYLDYKSQCFTFINSSLSLSLNVNSLTQYFKAFNLISS